MLASIAGTEHKPGLEESSTMSQALERLRANEAAIEKKEHEAEEQSRRYRPLFDAFQAVRQATPSELGVTGQRFYQEWAKRFCRVGAQLVALDHSTWLVDQQTTTDPAEAVAVEIYQLACEGKQEEIGGRLIATFTLPEADYDNSVKIQSRGGVNEWLRVRLARKFWAWLAAQQDTETTASSQAVLGEVPLPNAPAPRLQDWALAIEHGVAWHLFKKFG